jgi:hypothetical protein
MAEVSLLVTKAELDYVAAGRQNEQQIAVRSASEDVLDALMQIDGRNRRDLVIGGCIPLVMGDRGAIWRAYNSDRLEDFDALFALLARRPGREVRILCELR